MGANITRLIKDFPSSLNYDFDFVPAVGSVGGLLIMWRASHFSKEETFKEERFMGTVLKSARGNQLCLFGNIYAPNSEFDRGVFLTALGSWVLERGGSSIGWRF